MARDTTDDLTLMEESKIRMDRGLASVMPDSWHGHARITILGAELSDKQQDFALRLSKRLLDKEKTADSEKAAEVSIKKAKEQF